MEAARANGPKRPWLIVNVGQKMRFVFLVLSVALWSLCHAAEEPRIECGYGVSASCVGRLLVYPDFAIRFIAKRPGDQPWKTDYVFQVVSPTSGTKIMYFRFVMAGVYEWPELRIGGSRYIVELKPDADLSQSKLIIWDQASATEKNPIIFEWVWKSKRPKQLERGIIWQAPDVPNKAPEPTP